MKRRKTMKMDLQYFAEGGEGSQGAAGSQQSASQSTQQNGQQAPAFDYEKLAGIISGKQSVAEAAVLKNYFKNQGLSEEDMKQAISAFKEQKAKNTPDVKAMQEQLEQAQKSQMQAALDKEALLVGIELGLDVKTIPYVCKLADMSNAVDAAGKISQEKLKEAINKVLTDLPQLKPAAGSQTAGFRFGSSGGSADEAKATEEKLRKIFGLKN